MTSPNDTQRELKFRRSGRWIVVMFALFIPVMLLGFGLNRLLHSEVPLTAVAIVFLIILTVFTVRRFIAYYEWTGKHPFR